VSVTTVKTKWKVLHLKNCFKMQDQKCVKWDPCDDLDKFDIFVLIPYITLENLTATNDFLKLILN